MGLFTEAKLLALVDAGCPACQSQKLIFQTYVDGRQRLLGGEPDGKITWAYKGETFIDGIFDIKCIACKHSIFSEAVCPRCHADGGLAKGLETENQNMIPKACPGCDAEEFWCVGFLPATVIYEGRRAEKAKTETEMYDAGFHAFHLSCKFCGFKEEKTEQCPICDAPGPLRERPD
jgi:RNA polymerase subunit RPABC4/transcription elongation factor Spt4